MGAKHRLVLGSTKEHLCEAGKDCNYYRVCFDEKDNPTDKCALSYCERYIEDSGEQEKQVQERTLDIITNFESYDDYEENNYKYRESFSSVDEVIVVLQSMWYDKIQISKKFTQQERRAFELAIRLLELLQP